MIIYELHMHTRIKSSCSDSSGSARSCIMAGRCHKVISLSTTIAVIDAIKAGTKLKSEVVVSFGMPKRTVSTILKKRSKATGCL